MKKIIIALAVIIALAGGTYGAFVLLNQPTPPQTNVQAVQQTIEPITIQSLHEAVNAKRREAGVNELVLDDRLNQSALLKAQELNLEGWDDTPHESDDGKRGYKYIFETMPECSYGGENLYVYGNNTEHVVNGWMGSVAHRDAMLSSKYTKVGYAVIGDYVAQHFC